MGATAACFPRKKFCVFVLGEGEQDAALQHYLIINVSTCAKQITLLKDFFP